MQEDHQTAYGRDGRVVIKPGIVERAYELARTGDYATVTEIKRGLRSEGYINIEAYLQGGALLSALRKLCSQARGGQALAAGQ